MSSAFDVWDYLILVSLCILPCLLHPVPLLLCFLNAQARLLPGLVSQAVIEFLKQTSGPPTCCPLSFLAAPTPGPQLGTAYKSVTRSLKDELVVLKRPTSKLAFGWTKSLRSCVVERHTPTGAAAQGPQHSTAAIEVQQGWRQLQD
eukprot:scaffold6399_cov21-Tisochrysis_lutea.AAC.1